MLHALNQPSAGLASSPARSPHRRPTASALPALPLHATAADKAAALQVASDWEVQQLRARRQAALFAERAERAEAALAKLRAAGGRHAACRQRRALGRHAACHQPSALGIATCCCSLSVQVNAGPQALCM